MFSMTICAILGGVLGEKFGRKKMILFIAPLFVMSFVAQGLANNIYLLNVGRFVSGVAGGLIVGPAGVSAELYTIMLRRLRY